MTLFSPSPTTSWQDPAITALLDRWREGDRAAYDALVYQIYQQLHRMARRLLSRESKKTGFQTTALLHEAFLRLNDCQEFKFENRKHFFNTAGFLMRRILVERSRARQSERRGGRVAQQSYEDLEAVLPPAAPTSANLLALDRALRRLETIDPRRARMVDLKFFVGLSIAEIADVLAISETTAKRQWRSTRLWLGRQIDGQAN